MKRILSLLLITVLTVSSFTACQKNDGITHQVDELSITLPEEFIESPQILYGAMFESDTMAVKIIRETRSVVENAAGGDSVSLDAYAELVLKANNLDLPIEKKNGIPTYTYTALDEKVDAYYTYYVTLHQSKDAYWLIQFIVKKDLFDSKQSEIETILQSISFE